MAANTPDIHSAPGRWRRPSVTVGELIEALGRHDPDMPVVVDGYEDGYDSLCADSIAVISVVPDAAKTDWIGVVGDHQRPERLPEAGTDTGWGGELARSYNRDARATAPVTVLVLSRSAKQQHH